MTRDPSFEKEKAIGVKKMAEPFCKGALVLAVAGILVKIIGMIYKIPLTNLLHDEGMGYFNAAYTVYSLFYVVATAGLPTSLALLVSESLAKGDSGKVRRLFKTASSLFLTIGICASLLMALPARGFAALLGCNEAAAGILALSPALLFMTYAGAFRGFFQGQREMGPIALSQVLEAVGKLIFGLSFAYLALASHPLSTVSAYAVLGLTLASFLSLLSLIIAKKRFDRREGVTQAVARRDGGEDKQDRKKLFTIALPVTLSTTAMTLASSLDLFLVMRTLESIGFSPAQANSAWGNYSALAVPLFNMPTVLILPLAYSAAPFVKASLAQGNRPKAREASFRALFLAVTLALPASLGLSVLAKPILSLLYTDAASVASAAPLLSLLALSVFPLAMLSVTSTLLQSYGKLWFPILSVSFGIVLKLFVTTVGIRHFGMMGAPLGTFVCYAVVAALNLAYLVKISAHERSEARLLGRLFIKPFLAALPTAFSALVSYRFFALHLPETPATLSAIAFALLVFLLFFAALRLLSKEDALALGLSPRLTNLLIKIRILSKK